MVSYPLFETINVVYWKVRKSSKEPDTEYEVEGKRFDFYFMLFGAFLTPTTLSHLLYLLPVYILKSVFMQYGSDIKF